jgi:replicative DNA helicase
MLTDDQHRFVDMLMAEEDDNNIVVSSSQSVLQAGNYLNDMRKGVIQPLGTRFKEFNEITGGGYHWRQVHVIGGRSGVGKSALLNMLKDDFRKARQPLHILVHTMEMNAYELEIRSICEKFSVTKHQLTGHAEINKALLPEIKKYRETLGDERITYVESQSTVSGIERMLYEVALEQGVRFFVKARNGSLVPDEGRKKDQDGNALVDKGLVYTLDHTVLVKKDRGQNELDMLSKLIQAMIRVRKRMKICVILFSQLNRNIMQKDRLQLDGRGWMKELQYPQPGDIRGSDEIMYGTDFLMIVHAPEQFGIQSYGPHEWPTNQRLYWHILKQRYGGLGIMHMKNELAYSRIVQVN